MDHNSSPSEAAAPSETSLERVETALGQLLGRRDVPLDQTRSDFDALLLGESTDDAESEEVDAGGVTAVLVRTGAGSGVLVWLHGGGFLIGSARGYRSFAIALSRFTGLDVLVPDYRLAPEHRFPTALDDCAQAVDWAVATYGADRVIVGGDSVGGGLSVAALVDRRDRNLALPAGVVVVSPLADLTGSGATMATNAPRDAVISREMVELLAAAYAGDRALADPLASPVFADLAGLPPCLLLASARETLLDDAVRLDDSIRATGGSSRLSVYEDACHAWILFHTTLDSARRALGEIGDFCSSAAGSSGSPAIEAAWVNPPSPRESRSRGPIKFHRLRVFAAWLGDVARPTAVTTLDQAPANPDAITPSWMTEALFPAGDGRVATVTPVHLSSGTSVRSLLRVTYDDPRPDMPGSVFVKSTPTLRTRLQVGATGGAEAELRFYRDIQRTIDVPAPTGYFGVTDRVSGRSAILLEDLAATRDAEFGDPMTVHIDRKLAEALVDTLARLHGSLESSPRFSSDLRWVRRSLDVQLHLDRHVDFAERTRIGLDRSSDIVSPTVREARDGLHELLLRSLSLDEKRPDALVHTDVHAGNWFRTATGEMGLFDWSAIAKGQGPRDMAYALASALTVEDRRAWEAELVERYSDTLGEVTGRVRDTAAIWTSYREQTLHGLCYWLYTLGRGRLQPVMQPDDITRLNIERLAQATTDLESLKLVSDRS